MIERQVLARARELKLPIDIVLDPAVGLDDAERRRRQLAHAFEDRVRRRHHRVERHVVGKPDRIDARVHVARRDERRQGGGEAQALAVLHVVERLDAEAVAGEHEPARVPLVDGEGEHAVEALRRVVPPGVPGLEDHFGVARGEEPVALGLELGAQLLVVIDAAVEHERQAELGIDHRLLAALGQVDDLEPPVAERHAPARHDAFRVRPARGHGAGHGTQRLYRGRRAVERDLAAQTAHRKSLS